MPARLPHQLEQTLLALRWPGGHLRRPSAGVQLIEGEHGLPQDRLLRVPGQDAAPGAPPQTLPTVAAPRLDLRRRQRQ
eukprot:11164794-Lingulodinium_polyedra.AAC.1